MFAGKSKTWLMLATLAAFTAARASAQGVTGPIVSDSKVGYIDSAIPGNQLRLRYDDAYNNRRPSRAEFFYAKTGPGAPGLPLRERSVDFQDFSVFGEALVTPGLSAFVDVPLRLLNPDINDNTAGMGDLVTGLKYAFIQDETQTLSAQFRVFAPTGDADRGLGTNHVSLEPGLLYYRTLGCKAALEGELRYWIPVGGTEFAGDVIRYGIGARYEVFNNCHVCVNPVVELVGWTVLGGKEGFIGPIETQSAAGDTIFNVKAGVRVGFGDWGDMYGGVGRPLTGDRWYETIYRFEFRLFF